MLDVHHGGDLLPVVHSDSLIVSQPTIENEGNGIRNREKDEVHNVD